MNSRSADTAISRPMMMAAVIANHTRDSGIGIRPEDLPKVLAPFGQVRDAMAARPEGTGLGLPLAKALCELLGGTFDIESKAGVGTKVSIRFPEERVVR